MNEIETYCELMQYADDQLRLFCKAANDVAVYESKADYNLCYEARIVIEKGVQRLEFSIWGPGKIDATKESLSCAEINPHRKFTKDDIDKEVFLVMRRMISNFASGRLVKKWADMEVEMRKKREAKMAECGPAFIGEACEEKDVDAQF